VSSADAAQITLSLTLQHTRKHLVITSGMFCREESVFLPARANSRSLAIARDDNLFYNEFSEGSPT
jgi:hypothetical protein